jgi:hypothetical protein
MLTLDNAFAPLLKQIGVSYFESHSHLPPSINHAIRNYSNTHCNEHVNIFCKKSDISIDSLFEHVGYPPTLLIKQHLSKIIDSTNLRGSVICIDDGYVRDSMRWIIDTFAVTQFSPSPKTMFVDTITIVDCLEYFSILDKTPFKRIDGLSLTKDIGFMTALSIRQYIETADRYYLLPALPNIIEQDDVKLTTVLRFIDENAYDKLPIELANLISSVETTDDICLKETLKQLVGRTWPIDYHRFDLLLDITPSCPKIGKSRIIASNLAINPTNKTLKITERTNS